MSERTVVRESMDKTVAANPKSANKQSKNKKKQPLKVVYITNPIKFTATASEFRALVQELTGQDADVPDSSRYAAADDVCGGGAKEGNAHAAAESGGAAAEKGSDLSYEDDGISSPEMIDNFQGLESSGLWHEDVHVDVFKRLGAM